MNSLTHLSLVSLSERLEAREISSVEAAMAYLSRMTAVEPEIRAYITPTARIALEAASRADGMRRDGGKDGKLSPLCGVPYAVKDNFAVKDVPLTCASEMLRDFVPGYTAAVCGKIAEAGGVLLGKTNLDEFAMGSFCERSIAGPTRNPLDPARSPGGSSGGSAAAVAAGEAAWAIGSDTGGSARQPAAFCGLVSMKPTYGLVSRRGMVELASSLDTVCPIARTVEDCALALTEIAGRDPYDMTSFDSSEDYRAYTGRDPAGLTVGVPEPDALDGCEAAVVKAVGRAARILGTLGVRTVPVKLPLGQALEIYLIVASAEASSNLARFDGLRYGLHGEGGTAADKMRDARARGFGDEVKRRIVTGTYALSSTYGGGYYKKVKAAQNRICEETAGILARCDAVLLPTAATAAFRVGSYDGDPNALYRSDRFTTIANLTGCPAVQIPGGGNGSMPVGISLMGGKRSEGTLFLLAYALEQELREDVRKEVGQNGQNGRNGNDPYAGRIAGRDGLR
jgi:aspartyl-tRNA(Asn)/glutamyl-tRNA(Gln) amidotransferase subunit A